MGPDCVGPFDWSWGLGLEVRYILLEGSNSGVEGISDQSLEVCDCFIQLTVQVIGYNRVEGGKGISGRVGGHRSGWGGLLQGGQEAGAFGDLCSSVRATP